LALVELRAGTSRVALDPRRGGRLSSWTIDGVELLVGPPDDADASIHWGCFLMAPWPGRLAGGRFEWRGREVRVPRTHGRHAIHGLTWNQPWQVEGASPESATLAIELPRDEWPMGGLVRERAVVTPNGLRLEASFEAGTEPTPAALGWHPWFLRRGDLRLRVDAAEYQQTSGMIPTGAVVPVGGKTDLRAGPRLGRRRLDLAYLRARSPAVITWPDLELTVAFDPAPAPLVVYTPPGSFCVEPLTAPPNALADLDGTTSSPGAGIRILRPGERCNATLDFHWRRPDGGG
jgi:aldose 1-epimerase